MIRIAVDAMGGDHAPAAIVDGAVAAARHLDIQIALVGIPTQVEQALDAHADWRSLPVTIVDAPDVIEMADAPATVRRRPGASIRVAAALVGRREAAALVSAGHTGAAGRPCCSMRAPPSNAGPSTCCSSRSWGASTRAWRLARRDRGWACSPSV